MEEEGGRIEIMKSYKGLDGIDVIDDLPLLKLTAKAPENGWLEDDISFLGGKRQKANFSGELVSGKVDVLKLSEHMHRWRRGKVRLLVYCCMI